MDSSISNTIIVLTGVLTLILTAFSIIIGAAQFFINKRENDHEARLNDAEKLANIGFTTSQALKGDLDRAHDRVSELETDLNKFRQLVDILQQRVTDLEKKYDGLDTSVTNLMKELYLTDEEIVQFKDGQMKVNVVFELIRSRIMERHCVQ